MSPTCERRTRAILPRQRVTPPSTASKHGNATALPSVSAELNFRSMLSYCTFSVMFSSGTAYQTWPLHTFACLRSCSSKRSNLTHPSGETSTLCTQFPPPLYAQPFSSIFPSCTMTDLSIGNIIALLFAVRIICIFRLWT